MKTPLKRKHSSGSGDEDLSPGKNNGMTSPPANKTCGFVDDGTVTASESRISNRQAKKLKRSKTDNGPHQKCAHCKKKTGLASTYDCRCGEKFCSEHRYAEIHNCCFDYKSQGRVELLKNNPTVRAEKVAKI
ncbi:hypothetical protein BIW11_07222 [Tropilaelaps mercedesae]|uniref:AN1-type domain-containing protein n=1 Tax=Tropilaelaps mercedesae TaxID=418985 RepID=A0A1V9XUZ7_9ACAR|nr:hypothetical protein BIW11_07222 [Tropilaelaps mercedesae]